jgi:flagellin-like protein
MDAFTMMKLWIQVQLGKFVKDEKGEVNIVAMVILIGIAVVLAIIFKDAIGGLINSLLKQIEGNANNAIQGP